MAIVGPVVWITVPTRPAPDRGSSPRRVAAVDWELVFLDNHLMVVCKGAGLLSQADETGDADILTLGKAYLKQRFDKPGNVFLGLCHRLDRPVSGLMVLARTSKAAARLSRQFQEGRVDKHYLAVVEGRLDGQDRWDDHMIKEQRRSRIVPAGHRGAKAAALRWRALAHHQGFTLVEVLLLTGRPHQIRLQFSSRGFPLLGDLRHGASREFDGRNLALHAWRLALAHPIGAAPMVWHQAAPSSWDSWFAERRADLISQPEPDAFH